MVQLKEITSTNIHSVGYCPVSHVLAVRFKDAKGEPGKSVYHHKDVSPEIGNAMLAADSAGRFYASNVRGQYPHEKVDA